MSGFQKHRTIQNMPRGWLLPLVVFAVAFLIRFLYFFEISGDSFLSTPVLDADFYYHWAWRIVTIGGGKEPFLLNPGYAYLLSLIYRLFGTDTWIISVVQFMVGALSAVLVYSIGTRVFDRKVGLLAGVICAGFGPFVFYEGLLVNFAWINLFNLLALLLLIKAVDTNSFYICLFSGGLIGLSALFRPNILLFAGLVGLYIIFARRQWLHLLTSLVTGVLIALSPCLIRNCIMLSRPVISSVSSGINFYIGNHPSGDGSNGAMSAIGVQSQHPKYMLASFKRQAENELGRNISYTEMDRYWLKTGLTFVVSHPWRSCTILSKKVLLFFAPKEIASNYSYELVRDNSSRVLRTTPDLRIIMPVGILSLFWVLFVKRKDKYAYLLTFLFLTYFLTVVIFFMLSEYRLPAIPVLIIFASWGLVRMWQYLRQGKLRHVSLFITGLVTLFVLQILPKPFMTKSSYDYFYWRGELLMHSNRLEEAEGCFQKVIQNDPSSIASYQQLAQIASYRGKYEDALTWYQKALNVFPTALTYTDMGNILFRMGKYDSARDYYAKAIAVDEFEPNAWTGLGSAEYKIGNESAAYEAWATYLRLEPSREKRKKIEKNLKILSERSNKKLPGEYPNS